jgi:hypothetical protein
MALEEGKGSPSGNTTFAYQRGRAAAHHLDDLRLA